jgi:hypothetical protein
MVENKDGVLYASAEVVQARFLAKWKQMDEEDSKAEAAAAIARTREKMPVIAPSLPRADTLSPLPYPDGSVQSPFFVSPKLDSPIFMEQSHQSPENDYLSEMEIEPPTQSSKNKRILSINTSVTSSASDKKRKREVRPNTIAESSPMVSSVNPSPTAAPAISSLAPARKKSKAVPPVELKSESEAGRLPTPTVTTAGPSRAVAIPDLVSPHEHVEEVAIGDNPPDWYLRLRASTSRDTRPGDRQTLDRLGLLPQLIKDAKRPEIARSKQSLANVFHQISELLHELEFLKVKGQFIAQKRLLDNDYGLPQIFKPDVNGIVKFPSYIQDDARLLYIQWYNQIFERNLFVGILNMIRSKGQGPAIDPRFKKKWRDFGAMNLVNGQWWGSQICAVRDGAHGHTVAGIAGITGQGATSIVLSGDTYKETDRDEGDEIWYSGTKPSDKSQQLSNGTQCLLDSITSKLPVRVMRSANLPNTNRFRPAKGFRFDGLYEVLSSRIVNSNMQHQLFHMRRLPDQAPIRYTGVEARPSKQEMQTYDDDMKKYGRRGMD